MPSPFLYEKPTYSEHIFIVFLIFIHNLPREKPEHKYNNRGYLRPDWGIPAEKTTPGRLPVSLMDSSKIQIAPTAQGPGNSGGGERPFSQFAPTLSLAKSDRATGPQAGRPAVRWPSNVEARANQA